METLNVVCPLRHPMEVEPVMDSLWPMETLGFHYKRCYMIEFKCQRQGNIIIVQHQKRK